MTRLRSVRFLIGAALAAACLVPAEGCRKLVAAAPPGAEERLKPLAAALASARDADLSAAGVELPAPGDEFELSAAQARDLLQRLRGRMRLEPGVPTDLPALQQYRFFLRRVTDPLVERSRISGGLPRPYLVTVFELNADGHMDTGKCFSY